MFILTRSHQARAIAASRVDTRLFVERRLIIGYSALAGHRVDHCSPLEDVVTPKSSCWLNSERREHATDKMREDSPFVFSLPRPRRKCMLRLGCRWGEASGAGASRSTARCCRRPCKLGRYARTSSAIWMRLWRRLVERFGGVLRWRAAPLWRVSVQTSLRAAHANRHGRKKRA